MLLCKNLDLDEKNQNKFERYKKTNFLEHNQYCVIL